MWKTFVKQNDYSKGYTFDTIYRSIEEIKKENYIELFDKRYLTNNTGKAYTMILENDPVVPDKLKAFSESISNNGIGAKKLTSACMLTSSQVGILLEEIVTNKYTSVCMDSLFKNRDQFRYMIEKFFLEISFRLKPINIFVNSHGSLLDVLNEEMSSSKYNEDEALRRVITYNRVYDMDVLDSRILNHIVYDVIKSKYVIVNKYLFLDVEPEEVNHPMDEKKKVDEWL